MHKNSGRAPGEGGEGQQGAIRADTRAYRRGAVLSDLALVAAIVIHDPDFLVAGATGDKVDPGTKDPGHAEPLEDVVGELVGHAPGAVGIVGARIALAEHMSRGDIALRHLVEPAG